MNKYEPYLSAELRKIVSDLRDAFRAKNINATGNLSANTREVIGSEPGVTRGQIIAPSYIFTADDGRRPTVNNQGGILKKQILIWLQTKGVPLWPGFKTREAQAFVISRKIHKEGTLRFRDPSKRNSILADTIPQSRIDQIAQGVAKIAGGELVQSIRQLKLGEKT